MRVGTPGFIPARLVEIREIRRISTKKRLADDLKISPSTVSRWEDGTFAPDSDALEELSGYFNVRPEYFLRPTTQIDRPLFNRALASSLKKDRRFQNRQMSWLHEISHILLHYVDFPDVDIPDVLEGKSWAQLRDEDIEQIALDLRAHWGLGTGPSGDMLALLERIGVIVGTIDVGTTKLDGLCSWSSLDSRPHILLSNDKMSYPRRQMDAAHELAHAVLHKDVSHQEYVDNFKAIEMQAFRLASAFLMPSSSYVHEVTTPTLANLLSLKGRWRTAVKAQIKRLSDLKIIDKDQAVYLYKLYSAKGWNKGEPDDTRWPLTKPTTLRDALEVVTDAGVRTKEDFLSVEFVFGAADVEKLASLPAGWFTRKAGQVVSLKPGKSINSGSVDKPAEIVQLFKPQDQSCPD